MIVYVESNFVLEMALGQEQAGDAEQILNLSEEKRIQLVIPAFALSEPYSRIRQRGRDRQAALRLLSEQARDLRRSRDYQDRVSGLNDITRSMVAIEFEEMD